MRTLDPEPSASTKFRHFGISRRYNEHVKSVKSILMANVLSSKNTLENNTIHAMVSHLYDECFKPHEYTG